jgi:glycine dehydrogenase
VSNASLLDESTAAAEAMIIAFQQSKKKSTFLVDRGVLPQTIAVIRARAHTIGINVRVGNVRKLLGDGEGADEQLKADLVGVLVQYPDVRGNVYDWAELADRVHGLGGLVVAASDLLALTIIKPPGEWGADICVGSAQRFGVPLGYGGPHAAFFSCSDKLKRRMPGRLIGLSKDVEGRKAYRLALQTREQHIRREKATSNICTAQALLANMAAMYAVWHGPEGLRRIALRVHGLTAVLKAGIESLSHETLNRASFFDTIAVRLNGMAADLVHAEATQRGINFRRLTTDDSAVGISLDETTTLEDVVDILNVFVAASAPRRRVPDFTPESVMALADSIGVKRVNGESSFFAIPPDQRRTSAYLQQEVFNSYHSETEMLRYLHRLQNKDLSLVHAMIPLGSCTMKLNPTSAMLPFTKKQWGAIHPFVPLDQAEGYGIMHKVRACSVPWCFAVVPSLIDCLI